MNKRTDRQSEESKETDLDSLIRVMNEEHLDEIEIEDGDLHIKLSREQRIAPPLRAMPVHISEGAHSAAAVNPSSEPEGPTVPAPIAGVFYRSSSPAAAPFVKEGDQVVSGQPLCIIEAMKVMNEISAPSSGVVRKIKVENGKPVEANQTLFVLSPT